MGEKKCLIFQLQMIFQKYYLTKPLFKTQQTHHNFFTQKSCIKITLMITMELVIRALWGTNLATDIKIVKTKCNIDRTTLPWHDSPLIAVEKP